MAQYLIVGIIILAALGLAIYRVVYRPSCGCGCQAKGCKPKEKRPDPLAE
ncbi:MAG: FeoB-associated Cys-rich membrane protein [Deltaproteobacteria bacterium]|nr:FeoB-associated Cys-rich membrane protein [Deltaproteobacteria bacterium]